MYASYLKSIQNKRQVNEDRVLSIPLLDNKLELCLVIDGCGDANGVGDVVIKHLLKATPLITELSLAQLEILFLELNNCIRECRRYAYIGTYVCTMAIIDRKTKTIKIAHVGDTRAYMLHNQSLSRVTVDHSSTGMLEDAGVISEAEAKCHPDRHMVLHSCGLDTRYPGSGFVFLKELSYKKNDKFAILTDGVHDSLFNVDIFNIMNKATDPQTCVEELFNLAIEKGSTDNATAAVYFF